MPQGRAGSEPAVTIPRTDKRTKHMTHHIHPIAAFALSILTVGGFGVILSGMFKWKTEDFSDPSKAAMVLAAGMVALLVLSLYNAYLLIRFITP